ncbi:hypothetical protein SAMN05444395_11559, partial [Flavobacterium fryxellicola]
ITFKNTKNEAENKVFLPRFYDNNYKMTFSVPSAFDWCF